MFQVPQDLITKDLITKDRLAMAGRRATRLGGDF
jgi:hypothetical protein